MRLALVLLLLLAPPALAQTPQRKLVELLCERYAARGFEIDVDELRIETATAERMAEDLDAQQSFFFAPRYFTYAPYLYDAVGLLPPNGRDRFREIAVRDSAASVQAYFHYERTALVFVDHELTKLTGLEPLLAHELAHAWRHVTHDMSELAADEGRTWDQARTLQCMLEGEAELIALDLMLSRARRALDDLEPGTLESPLAGVAHPVAVLPYDKGREFMLRRYLAGGWEAVHGAVDSMPSSSEQVLHPEKLGADEPVSVELPPFPDVGRDATVTQDVVGEFGILSLLLAKGVSRGRAELCATGWDGDRVALLRAGDDWLLGWRTVWDRDEDAAQFAETFGELVEAAPRANGRVVDWTWSSSAELADRYREELARAEWDAAPQPGDAATTARAEDEIRRRFVSASLRDGVFTYPKFALSLPVPAGWELVEQNGAFYVMAERVAGFRDNISVIAIPRSGLSAEQVLTGNRRYFQDSKQFDLKAIEQIERDGTSGVEIEYTGSLNGFDLRFFAIILLADDEQVVVTITMLDAHAGDLREAARGAIEGARLTD